VGQENKCNVWTVGPGFLSPSSFRTLFGLRCRKKGHHWRNLATTSALADQGRRVPLEAGAMDFQPDQVERLVDLAISIHKIGL
jgi:hypothetical protein